MVNLACVRSHFRGSVNVLSGATNVSHLVDGGFMQPVKSCVSHLAYYTLTEYLVMLVRIFHVTAAYLEKE